MLAEGPVVGGFNDESVLAITTRGRFSAIINLDEDRPHKIFILMAPNYPEQRPATQKSSYALQEVHSKPDKSTAGCGERSMCCMWLSPPLFSSMTPCKRNVPYIAACLCRSATPAGLDLKWWLMQFSTSWVSFRSSSSIHLRYKRKPPVSAEPRRQTCQTTS